MDESMTESAGESRPQRLFVAAPLPDGLKRTLGEWARSLHAAHPFRKWTHEADLHVTLQFLGDAAPDRVPALKEALAAAAASGALRPFRLALAGVGTFGLPERPRVFWASLGGESGELRRLQRLVVEATAPLGYEAEKRSFSPHLTLARNFAGRDPFVLPVLPPELAPAPTADGRAATDGDSRSWSVDEIVLYRTHMHRRPMYEAAGRFRLG
ncbi:2'-5' RNA ligase [Paenibacillus sp. UNC496MF]|uniref:RNA 2',3'-cyclic phosphodiesterase n=1 Tax=Paenibacillus sp. UNC496MF TaxID=1502753 RepID=UPI0008EDD4B7|nr:RNA 2',3'-cyclic phosphodiesterase [Paenibacillus sp. UNC496MF]SFI37717.1 2'-5' RNA ligase [Paenibacillus sp. UNC496MF]